MSKYAELFTYLKECPQLANLISIAGLEAQDNNIIYPLGSSTLCQYRDRKDVQGNYLCDVIPFPSVYEEYQINCYRFLDNKDVSEPAINGNVLTLDEVQAICDWIQKQNEEGNLPTITGKQVVSIECNPFVPQVAFVDNQENIIAYFIVIRIRYVNKAKSRLIEYDRD